MNDLTRMRRGRAPSVLAVALLTLVAALGLSSPAFAGTDPLSGGSVVLQLKGSKGLKVKPSNVTVSITGGKLDPVTGGGEVFVSGSFKARLGKRKTKVQLVSLTFGANGGPGEIVAKIRKKKVNRFASLSGGTTVRDGFGAKITGVTTRLGSKGAAALKRAFFPKKTGGGKASASAARGGSFRGTVSATTIPKTVEVLPGGSMTMHAPPSLVAKLAAHCIVGIPGGVDPIAPATANLATTTFPVTGGSLAPNLTDGRVATAGGQRIAKNNGLGVPFACDQPPAVGTAVTQNKYATEFNTKAVTVEATLPDGTILGAAIGIIDFSTGTMSFDPATRTATVTGAAVTFDRLAADSLNNIFPNRSGDPNNDFSTSDSLGTLDLTATLR